jgi:hypothetical protein
MAATNLECDGVSGFLGIKIGACFGPCSYISWSYG